MKERKLKGNNMENLEAIKKLTKDLKKATVTLSDQEARYLVDAYYIMQDDRKRSYNQERALDETNEPNLLIGWLAENSQVLENNIKSALGAYAASKPIGVWSQSICGIGPVISAGLIAHIDIHKAPTVGHIWNYAGLNPMSKWEKGQKRPWNASLKTLCWKIGQSFMKVQGNDKDIYGKLYKKRKEFEIERNERGDNREIALEKAKLVGKSTDAYKWYSGEWVNSKTLNKTDRTEIFPMLCPAQIDARARRWAVKLFLAHWHEQQYRFTFGKEPPLPYPIAILGHAHKI